MPGKHRRKLGRGEKLVEGALGITIGNTFMKGEKILKYRGYTFKLNEKTVKLLRKNKKSSGLSWNLFIYKLLTKKCDGQMETERPQKI